MNETMNKFLLAGDKCMPHDFTYSTCGPFTKNKERIESLCRLEIQILFTEMSLIKLVFNMIWLMVNQTFSKKDSIRQSFKR